MTFHFLKDLQGPGRAIRQRTFSLRRGGCHEQQAHLVRGIITVGKVVRDQGAVGLRALPRNFVGKHPHVWNVVELRRRVSGMRVAFLRLLLGVVLGIL